MSIVLPAPIHPTQAAQATSFVQVALLTIGGALVIPYVLIGVLGGSHLRTIYPAYILAAACLVIANRRPLYPAFMLAVFAFSPFLRRVADYQAGFAVFNLILLAPYVGLLPTLPALLRRAFGGSRTSGWPFAVILACVVYGSFLALFHLAFVAAIYDAMRWLLPTSIAAFIMAEPAQAETVRRTVIQALCLILPILTLYGIYQYMYAPLWDVFWMWNVANVTFGEAEAYKIRVFSMMNSPGTVGVFSSYAMILLAGDGLGALAIAAIGLPLLGLTLVRTAWLSLAVGLLVLLLRASGRRRLVFVASVAGIGFLAAALVASRDLPPDIGNIVTERISTFSSLNTDSSAGDRLSVYDAFFGRLSASPWGEGYGADATTASAGSKRDLVSLDSGWLDTFLTFGLLGGTLYFIALTSLLFEAWRALPSLRGRLDGNFAVVCAAMAILPLGSNNLAEQGVLLWTALGTLFASAECLRRGQEK